MGRGWRGHQRPGGGQPHKGNFTALESPQAQGFAGCWLEPQGGRLPWLVAAGFSGRGFPFFRLEGKGEGGGWVAAVGRGGLGQGPLRARLGRPGGRKEGCTQAAACWS